MPNDARRSSDVYDFTDPSPGEVVVAGGGDQAEVVLGDQRVVAQRQIHRE